MNIYDIPRGNCGNQLQQVSLTFIGIYSRDLGPCKTEQDKTRRARGGALRQRDKNGLSWFDRDYMLHRQFVSDHLNKDPMLPPVILKSWYVMLL